MKPEELLKKKPGDLTPEEIAELQRYAATETNRANKVQRLADQRSTRLNALQREMSNKRAVPPPAEGEEGELPEGTPPVDETPPQKGEAELNLSIELQSELYKKVIADPELELEDFANLDYDINNSNDLKMAIRTVKQEKQIKRLVETSKAQEGDPDEVVEVDGYELTRAELRLVNDLSASLGGSGVQDQTAAAKQLQDLDELYQDVRGEASTLENRGVEQAAKILDVIHKDPRRKIPLTRSDVQGE